MKATMYRSGPFGPMKTEITMQGSVTPIDWAQYRQVPSLIYIEKGKRTRMQMRADRVNPDWLIVEGWKQPEPPSGLVEEIGLTGVVRRSMFGSFDPRYADQFNQFADSVKKTAKVVFDGREVRQ